MAGRGCQVKSDRDSTAREVESVRYYPDGSPMIIHIDMDAFYASVELRDDPALAGKPVVVGGSPRGRGVIAAASYEARKFGIHSAMASSAAIRLCPGLIFIKPRMDHYAAISKQIREIFERFTSLVEPLSLDEAFLDVSGSTRLFGSAREIALQIRDAIRTETGLIASAGVAPNKFLAKLASDLEKPDGFVVVAEDGIQDFLDPLPIERVWGIGKKTSARLRKFGLRMIRDIRALDTKGLKTCFGANCEHFYRLSRGLDTRAVVPDRIAKSISHETTFRFDISDTDALAAWTLELADQVARRMRHYRIHGRTVQIKIRYPDFRTITRAQTLSLPTCSTRQIAGTASELLLKESDSIAVGCRLLGLGVSNLSSGKPVQQSLFDVEENRKMSRLEAATDELKDKFGAGVLRRGTSLEHSVRFRPGPRPGEKPGPE
ncbi:MAG: DNA polymerase IV [Planctomycetota bacterium]